MEDQKMLVKIKEYKTCIIQESKRNKDICCDIGCCRLIEDEKERSVDSLKGHLSEQRHDFFNLLQILYGYTQLNKPDKVLAHITDYCKQIESIGKLYNCKCIKLADLLYTKCKEAESIDMKLKVSIDISFDSIIRILDNQDIVYAVDHVISGFLYVLAEKDCKNAHVMFSLEEDAEKFHMEIYCKELRERQFEPISFVISPQVTYWKKIERSIASFDRISKHCKDCGFYGGMLEDGVTYIMSITKGWECSNVY
jgi:hypothetical protein